MEDSSRPLSPAQRKELEGYIAWSTRALRVGCFAVLLVPIGLLLRACARLLGPQFGSAVAQSAWVVALFGIAVGLFLVFRRGTGGRRFRQQVAADLRGDVALVRRVNALDAVEVEEAKDEGPAYLLLTSDGRTLLLAGQYLEKYRRSGFPWRAFDIIEAPHSKVFFALEPAAESLRPSARRRPFSWDELKRDGSLTHHYVYVEHSFEALKRDVP